MAILGIDEVGRGPLAGPLVVGAVILPEDEKEWFAGLKDSKKLSVKKREELNSLILRDATATGLGWVSVKELDEVGIAEALRLATKRAVKSIQQLNQPFSQIVIDGKVNFLKGTALEEFVSTMPKADDLIREVSAASIIAKVARDQYMVELADKYSQYGFETHVGYGTAKHLAAIRKYGVTPEHRKSFEPIKSMVGFSRPVKTIIGQSSSMSNGAVKNTTSVGKKAESVVAEYLVKKGHKIIERNYKTKFAEIDIISVKNDKVYFTEVKYRRSSLRGGGLAAITRQKQDRMRFAAESYLKYHQDFTQLSPILAVADVGGEKFCIEDWFVLT